MNRTSNQGRYSAVSSVVGAAVSVSPTTSEKIFLCKGVSVPRRRTVCSKQYAPAGLVDKWIIRVPFQEQDAAPELKAMRSSGVSPKGEVVVGRRSGVIPKSGIKEGHA